MVNTTTMYVNFTVLMYFSHYDEENVNENVFCITVEQILGKKRA